LVSLDSVLKCQMTVNLHFLKYYVFIIQQQMFNHRTKSLAIDF